MSNLKKLIAEQENIAVAVEEAGFAAPLFFKGFSKKEEHYLCIAVKDRYTIVNEARPSLTRRLELEDKIIKIMGCKIMLHDYKRIQTAFLEKLLAGRCAKLTLNASDKEAKVPAESKLTDFNREATSHFGEGWTFVPESVEELAKVTTRLAAKAEPSSPLPEFKRWQPVAVVSAREPLEEKEEKELDAAAQLIAEKLHAGGKFNKADIDYEVTRFVKKVENKLGQLNRTARGASPSPFPL